MAASGLWLLSLLAGNPLAAARTDYGEILVFKLSGVLVLLLLAAYNKLRLTPRLLDGQAGAAKSLRASIALEAKAVAVIFFFTSAATTVTSPSPLTPMVMN